MFSYEIKLYYEKDFLICNVNSNTLLVTHCQFVHIENMLLVTHHFCNKLKSFKLNPTLKAVVLYQY